MSAAGEAAVGGDASEPLDLAERFGQPWVLAPAVQTMHGGETLRTYGVRTADGLWVGRAHPIGPGREEQALAKRHAALFAP